jgi:hypothetical protein
MKSTPCHTLVVAFWLLGAFAATAADIIWTNTAGGNWSEPVNWSPNQLPYTNDHALVTAAGTYTVSMDSTGLVARLTVGGIQGTQTIALVAGGSLYLTDGGVIETNGAMELSGGVIGCSGELTVNGRLDWCCSSAGSAAVLRNNGVMSVRSMVSWHFPSIANSGRLRFDAHAHVGGGGWTLENRQTGVIEVRHQGGIGTCAFFCGSGYVVNHGALRMAAGNAGFTAALDNFGIVEIAGGSLGVEGYRQFSGATVLAAGRMNNFSDSDVRFLGGLLTGAGLIWNPFAYNRIYNNAHIAPDPFGAGLEFNASFVQGPAGVLHLDIAGPLPGMGLPQVRVNGGVTLGGTVNLCLTNRFVPPPGTLFGVMTFTTNTASGAVFLGLDAAKGLHLEPQWCSNHLALAASAKYPGPAPSVHAVRRWDGVAICWPLGYDEFQLQQTPSIAAGQWLPAALIEPNRLVLPAGESLRLFRLAAP